MTQNFENVFIESLGVAQPSRRVTSLEIEQMLGPVYDRLGLAEGRLELMTGIKERRFADKGTRPSDLSIQAGRNAIESGGIDVNDIGCVIHSAVCRDFLEPATATVVHSGLGLRPDCQIFDLSNACLGWLNGLTVVANMIELGQIKAGLVVSGEDGRGLVESTIEELNADQDLTRKTIKKSFASLTIGSGGVAALLVHKDLQTSGHRLQGCVVDSASDNHKLCQGGVDSGQSTTGHVTMNTDSEAMLGAGVDLAVRCFHRAKDHFGFEREQVDHLITHQVGSAHSKLLFQRLELDESKDFPTYPFLGNMGSASIGTTLELANQDGRLKSGDQVLMMGIGSGLVTMMMGVQW